MGLWADLVAYNIKIKIKIKSISKSLLFEKK
jgi:hypothetical protein